MISTQIIVLSKRPYKESSLLIAGLSPDYGKVYLVVNGAQKLDSKHYPEVDLFRELAVEYNTTANSDLYTAKNVELEFAFDSIANNKRNFLMAGKIANFLLQNCQAEIPQPYTYDVLRSIFSQLSQQESQWSLIQCAVVFKTTFLYENGLLPETENYKSNEFIENLIASGIENSDLPQCDNSYWKTLNDWLDSIISFHGLKKS